MSMDLQLSKGMRESLDIIFSAVLFGGIEKDNPIKDEKKHTMYARIQRFFRLFKHNVFHDEYSVFYEILAENNIIVFSEGQLVEILTNNAQSILESSKIDFENILGSINKMEISQDEVLSIFNQFLIRRFKELSNNFVDDMNFESAMEIYRQSYSNLFIADTVNKMALMLSDGGVYLKDFGKRKKFYQGLEAARDFYTRKNNILETLMIEDDSGDVVINADWYAKHNADMQGEAEALVGTSLQEIDNIFGSLHRTYMYTILGPTKGGKTTLTAFLTTILLLNGYNVAVWPIEGKLQDWHNMIISSMCFLLAQTLISRSTVQKRNFATEEERQLVNSMELMLATDDRLGRLSFITGTCYVEELREKLRSHHKNNNKFDCIVIDQLIKILSKTGKPKVDRIGEGYTILENFCKKDCETRPMALLPSQLKPKVVEALRKDASLDIQDTDGAESSEVIRSADAVLGLFSTDQEKDAGIMKIHCVASRHTAKFRPFRCGCDLGAVSFWSDPNLDQGQEF